MDGRKMHLKPQAEGQPWGSPRESTDVGSVPTMHRTGTGSEDAAAAERAQVPAGLEQRLFGRGKAGLENSMSSKGSKEGSLEEAIFVTGPAGQMGFSKAFALF